MGLPADVRTELVADVRIQAGLEGVAEPARRLDPTSVLLPGASSKPVGEQQANGAATMPVRVLMIRVRGNPRHQIAPEKQASVDCYGRGFVPAAEGEGSRVAPLTGRECIVGSRAGPAREPGPAGPGPNARLHFLQGPMRGALHLAQ